MVLSGLVWIISLAAFIWIVYDVFAVQKESMTNGKKAMWVILGFLFSIITAVVYYFVVKKK